MADILQGDVLSVEKQSHPLMVVSKNFFNQSGQVIACPLHKKASPDPLHIPIRTNKIQGIVLCEQMKLFDLHVRGYKKIAETDINAIMDITDAIQGIFDYYPYK